MTDGSALRTVLRRVSDPFYEMRRRLRRHGAAARRRLAHKTTFIGITGSHGKTTATELLGKILAAQAPTFVGAGLNVANDVVNALRGVRQWDGIRPWRYRYWVQEVATSGPATIDAGIDALQPTIGIVTAISGDHRKAFGTLEAIAAEKAKLVQRLPPGGLAVLNADDPLVAAMAACCRCRVVTYGRSRDADMRLIGASSPWPGRLTCEVAYRGERIVLRTQFVGTHWVVSLMAALLTALELGIPTRTCLAVIENFEPLYNRMSVHRTPEGAWYILDAHKSSFLGIGACLGFLAEARAPRKTVVFGTLSDYAGASRATYYKATRMALASADRVIFTGANASRVRRLAEGEFAGRLFVRERTEDLLTELSADPIPDEVIYVKATRVDRLAGLLVPNVKGERDTSRAPRASG